MNDQEFTDLLLKARHASQRVDFSAQEYGFETRLASKLAGLPFRGPSALEVIWRSAAGCAALVGFMAVWFVVMHAPTETEDELTAFWDSGQISFDADFFN